MNDAISKLLSEKYIILENGDKIDLQDSIDIEEVNFLQKIIKENNIKEALEVGCAMGVSSLAICDAIAVNSADSHHIIVDPFQSTDWRNIGIRNLKKAGFTNFTLLEEKSELVLPTLVKQKTIDFGFIDGWHTFDHTMIDFFYINRMLKVGGVVVIDDVQMPAVNKVIRYIHNYPCYEFIGAVTYPQTLSRNIIEFLKSILRPVTTLLGKRVSNEFFSSSVLKSDQKLGTNSSMVAFKKIKEDFERPWNWYENF